jgi:hypothetical protein
MERIRQRCAGIARGAPSGWRETARGGACPPGGPSPGPFSSADRRRSDRASAGLSARPGRGAPAAPDLALKAPEADLTLTRYPGGRDRHGTIDAVTKMEQAPWTIPSRAMSDHMEGIDRDGGPRPEASFEQQAGLFAERHHQGGTPGAAAPRRVAEPPSAAWPGDGVALPYCCGSRPSRPTASTTELEPN